jgi:hypothetical protein
LVDHGDVVCLVRMAAAADAWRPGGTRVWEVLDLTPHGRGDWFADLAYDTRAFAEVG